MLDAAASPLTSFAVHNYRAFAARTEIQLRPLNLLFGYNSVGKSALLRALPLLAASCGSDAVRGPLALSSRAVRGASFADLRSRFDDARPSIAFGLGWADLRAEYVIRDWPEQRRQVVETLHLRPTSGADVLLRWNGERPTNYELDVGGASLGAVSARFDGLVPVVEAPEAGAAVEVLEAAARRLHALHSGVHWLGSLRRVPPRSAPFAGPPARMAPDGEHADEILAYDKLAGGRVLARASQWYQEATGHTLEVGQDISGENFRVLLGPAQGQLARIPMIDTGEGMAQSLPIIVLGALAQESQLDPGAVLAIEHPELHLHPAAHAELARFFCELAAGSRPAPTLIETHSENFLLRVQLAIIRGELEPDQVWVYWVRPMEDGPAVVEQIEFDELARPIGSWPPGVFSEDLVQARELVLARRQKQGQ